MDQKLNWKLRRVAACIRQQDVARRAGLTVARYGGIERGEIKPSDEERRSIEAILPPLPSTGPRALECVPAGGPAQVERQETSAESSP
jgi:transcriptional regulator with XRE-family HTH domain